MKIHEYQGKELFRKYGVPVPIGIPAFLLGPCGTAPGSFAGVEALNRGTTRREGDHHVEGL